MSKIEIEGMKFYAYHGFYKAERRKGNHFVVDITIRLNFDKAAKKDSIVGTIDYVKVHDICLKQMKKKRKLLESVAYQIAEEIKSKYQLAQIVKVKIAKLHPPLNVPTRQFSVTYTAK